MQLIACLCDGYDDTYIIKNFTVAGDNGATANSGYFGTENSMTGQTASGGTSKLSSVASISVSSQEHATDAIAVLDAAIAKIDQQRADLGAISNRLSSVVDNNTSMVTNTESSKAIFLILILQLKQLNN